jgi:hypothetical protein
MLSPHFNCLLDSIVLLYLLTKVVLQEGAGADFRYTY